MPRVDRRPRQRLDAQTRRSAILRAAGEAFSSQPYDKVSVAGIAAAAGASEALVHRYFAGKTGLYLALVEAGVAKLVARQEEAVAAAGDDARARLTATITVYLDTVARWSTGWLNPYRASGEPTEAVRLRQSLRAGYTVMLRELLHLPDEPALGYALFGYLSFLDAACLHWADRGFPPADRDTLTAQAVAALAASLAAAGRPGVLG